MVADALSQKSYQVEEAPLSLNHAEVLAHIALVSDLLEQIIIEQRQDVSEIPQIKKLIAEGRGLILVLMTKVWWGSRIDWLFHQVRSLEERFWMRPILPSCPSILAVIRCTMICATCIGGPI